MHNLISALPDITPIAVRQVLASIDRVLQGILVAVKAANLVLLLVGAVALAGAMAATHNARLRETVIFKVLGATRQRILSVHFMEYLVLALLSALIASTVWRAGRLCHCHLRHGTAIRFFGMGSGGNRRACVAAYFAAWSAWHVAYIGSKKHNAFAGSLGGKCEFVVSKFAQR